MNETNDQSNFYVVVVMTLRSILLITRLNDVSKSTLIYEIFNRFCEEQWNLALTDLH